MSLWCVDFVVPVGRLDEIERHIVALGTHRFAFTGDQGWQDADPGSRSSVEGLSFFVQARESADAREQGLRLAGAVLEAAKLDLACARLVAVHQLYPGDDQANELMDTARALLTELRFGLAVVCAQTACEITVRHAITTVVEDDGAEIGTLALQSISKFALMDSASKRMFEYVFGVKPSSLSWWPGYVAHVARRNQVVHLGAVVAEREARDSVAVAEQLLTTIRYRSLGLTEAE